MSSRVRLEADADIPLHPDGAILYRENSSRSVVPSLPRIRRYIKITRRRASSESLLAFLAPLSNSQRQGWPLDREQNPSRIKSVPPN